MSENNETPPTHIISEILDNYSENIPENDYLRAQNALMQIHNQNMQENVEDEEPPRENQSGHPLFPLLCMRNVPIENRISRAKDYILKLATINNGFGKSGTDIPLWCHCDAECKLTYVEIKNELVPLLQAIGFDIRLYYTVNNHFIENHFDDGLSVIWEDVNDIPLNMIHKIEHFPKTTEEYFNFEEPPFLSMRNVPIENRVSYARDYIRSFVTSFRV